MYGCEVNVSRQPAGGQVVPEVCVERSERSSDGLWAYVWLNRQGLLGLALDGCPLDLTEDLRSHL
jgi:hypothetical protein